MTVQQWQGPLPPPGALDQFNHIIPNGADRIMRMVEEEQAHRISHDKQQLAATVGANTWGRITGFALSLAAISGSVYTAAIGAHPTVSIALVSLPIMAAVRAFLRR